MARQRGIYVEILMRAPLEQVWRLTQEPSAHQRWDLRFSEIRYLPRATEAEPQRFLYATRIGFGLAIRGTGQSVGERIREDGEATSSLSFSSDDPKSLIRTGSGYWRYIPTERGIRFFTWYDYETRFGAPGWVVDRCVFRPLIGWATAWSFDRLRFWLEQGQTPEVSSAWTWVYALARCAVGFTWLWHGIVPKLLAQDAAERLILAQADMPPAMLTVAGVAEVVMGAAVLLLWRSGWPLGVTIVGMLLALASVAWHSPQFVTAAFNPVTLNLLVVALCAIAWVAMPHVPSARRCLRRKKETE